MGTGQAGPAQGGSTRWPVAGSVVVARDFSGGPISGAAAVSARITTAVDTWIMREAPSSRVHHGQRSVRMVRLYAGTHKLGQNRPRGPAQCVPRSHPGRCFTVPAESWAAGAPTGAGRSRPYPATLQKRLTPVIQQLAGGKQPTPLPAPRSDPASTRSAPAGSRTPRRSGSSRQTPARLTRPKSRAQSPSRTAGK